MCWAVPAKVIEVDGQVGKVELTGTIREVGLHFVEEPQVGDYVLLHAGFAIQKLDEEEAHATLELMEGMLEEAERHG